MLVSQATQDAMDTKTKTVFERARLESAVIEAAKAWRRNIARGGAGIAQESALSKAIDALSDFESQQEK